MRNNCFHRTAATRSLRRSCTRALSQTTTREEARVRGTSRPSCTKSGDHEPRLSASTHERRHHVHNTCQASSTAVRHQLQFTDVWFSCSVNLCCDVVARTCQKRSAYPRVHRVPRAADRSAQSTRTKTVDTVHPTLPGEWPRLQPFQ